MISFRWMLLCFIIMFLSKVMSDVPPTCQVPKVVSNATNKFLSAKCRSEKFFSNGSCSIQHRGLYSNISANVTFSKVKSIEQSGKYHFECSWSVFLSEVSPGSLQIQAKIQDSSMSITSNWTEPLNLSYPTVALAANCPAGSSVKSGYVLIGTTASCRCEVTSVGYPPGSAQWYNESGAKVGRNEQDRSATLDLSDSTKGSKFICQPVTELKNLNPQKVVFDHKFAVGPTAITIDMSDAVPLCPNESFTYQVTCKVPSTNVMPQPLFTISINNEIVVRNKTGTYEQPLNKYFVTHTFRPQSGGAIRVYCKAMNEIFTELFRDQERPLIIKEPPKITPVLRCLASPTESTSKTCHIPDGSSVLLICNVSGGYPEVSNVTIICGNISNSMSGTLASLTITMSSSVNLILCQCSAWHVSGCFTNRAEIVLTLADSGVLNMTSSQATISAGKDSTINSALIIGLGSGFGGVFLLLIVVIVVVIIVWKRRRTNSLLYNHPDFNSCPSYQYASFMPGRHPTPQPPLPIDADDHDYAVISLNTNLSQTSLKGIVQSMRPESATDSLRDSEIPEGYSQPI